MPKELIYVELDDEHTVIAEVDIDDATGDGLSPIARGGRDVAAATSHSVQSAMKNTIVPTARVIFGHLWSLPHNADEISLDFGLKFNSKVGLVIATSEVEGNIRVTLTWKRVPAATGSEP